MNSFDQIAAAIAVLIRQQEMVRAQLAAIRASVLHTRNVLHGQLGGTRHPLIINALASATLAAERVRQADAYLAVAARAAHEQAEILGLSMSGSPPASGQTVIAPAAARAFDRDQQYARLPRFAANGDRTTHGRAVDSYGIEHRLRSGDKKHDAQLIEAANDRLREGGLLPGRSNSARASDVEQKFATKMRLEGIPEADLVINHPDGPCRFRLGCDRTIPTLLNQGQRLTVHWRDQYGEWHQQRYDGQSMTGWDDVSG